MCYGIVQDFADGIFIILLHRVRKQRSTWQFAHRHITYLAKDLIHRQDKRDGEMLIILHNTFLILPSPRYLRTAGYIFSMDRGLPSNKMAARVS